MGLGSWIRDPEKNLFRIPDPGVKKAPDPGSRIRNTAYLCREPFVTFLPQGRTGRFHILDSRPPPPPGTPRRRPAEGMTPRRRQAEGRPARCLETSDSWPREKHRSAVVQCAAECSSVKPDVVNLLLVTYR